MCGGCDWCSCDCGLLPIVFLWVSYGVKVLVCVLCVVCGVNVRSSDGVGVLWVGIVVDVSSPRVWWGGGEVWWM